MKKFNIEKGKLILKKGETVRAKTVTEGSTPLYVPWAAPTRSKGPASRSPVFYNPTMEFARDVSVLLTACLPFERGLDGMAGVGARGVRMAHEAHLHMTINDHNPTTVRWIERNVALNGVEDMATTCCEDINVLLSQGQWEYVDIDPFGSPAPFVDSAMRSMSHRRSGVLGITATDTAPLCGVYPAVCERRYGGMPMRAKCGKEIGVRILIGFCQREAAKYDLAVEPLLVHATDHYVRVYLKTERGAGAASAGLKKRGWFYCDPKTGARGFSDDDDVGSKNAGSKKAGPLWTAPLFEPEIIRAMTHHLDELVMGTERRLRRSLDLWMEEALITVPYYETDELASLWGVPPPPMDFVIQALREQGMAARTHFSPTGFKTDVPLKDIKRVFHERT